MATRTQRHTSIRKKQQRPPAWNTGLSRLQFEITPELKAFLEQLASRTGMSLSQVSSILLIKQLRKRLERTEGIHTTLPEGVDHEYDRVEDALTRLLSPYSVPTPQKRRKKGTAH